MGLNPSHWHRNLGFIRLSLPSVKSGSYSVKVTSPGPSSASQQGGKNPMFNYLGDDMLGLLVFRFVTVKSINHSRNLLLFKEKLWVKPSKTFFHCRCQMKSSRVLF